MGNASYVQTDFRGGRWSTRAQGKMHDPKYKSALALCYNSMPLYNGPWTRRPGFLWGGNTRLGQKAKLLDCYLKFSQPFQIELTQGYLRAHAGLANVFAPDAGIAIQSISTANPAVVTVRGAIPSTWNNLDTIMFNFVAPASSPILAGRQFQIQSLTTNTFALYDGITGASIDGSVQPYSVPTYFGTDQAFKVMELTGPWTTPMLDQMRLVQTDATAVLMHLRMQPQSLTVPPAGAFALATQAFKDGPYLDINSTTTTLTPGSTSGNVVFTANATAGINGGQGFLPTDVNRALRFQSAPAAWSGATTYAANALVTGSDNNIYQSITGGNLNHNPTTDGGINWTLTGQTVVWVWGYITVVTSPIQVTVAIQPAAVTGRSSAAITGDTLPSTSASTSWQLGLFSDTTGWPQGGAYHEGRLWLYGSAVTNRVDASCANDVFNFAPSAPDGTVGDGNGIAKQGNAPKLNQVFWMLTTQNGLLMGALDSEWLVYASNTGDPLTPTTTQLRRVSTYGCANVEPQSTELTMCFVQREQQRVLNYANYPYGEATGWYADNLSENADDISAPGIAEIRWQQEPSKFLWARCNDGSLIGTTFDHPAYGKEGYNGWHSHAIGGGRTVTSISTGPADDGLTTALYMVAFNPTSGFYEYLELGHIFDKTQLDAETNFVDGLAKPSVAKQRAIAAGDAYNGITVYGLYPIIGQTVTFAVGGLDVGDFVVQGPDGHIDVPYTTTFTAAFLNGLAACDQYGPLEMIIVPVDTNSYTHFGAGLYNPTTNNLGIHVLTSFNMPILVTVDCGCKDLLIGMQPDGVRVFNAETMAEITNATSAQITNNQQSGSVFAGGGVAAYHPGNNCIYAQYGTATNSSPIVRIDVGLMKATGTFGIHSSSFLAGAGGFGTNFNSIFPLTINNRNVIGMSFITSASHVNGLGLIDGDSMTYMASGVVSDPQLYQCPGVNGAWYGLSTPVYGAASTTPISIYTFGFLGDSTNPLAGGAITGTTPTGTVSPAQVDATWTHFSAVGAPMFDPTDGNIIAYFQTTDAVTNVAYWVKINPATAAVVWTCADTSGVLTNPISKHCAPQQQMPGGKLRYARTGKLWTLDTTAGTLSSVTFPSATVVTASDQIYWPEKNSVICHEASLTYSGSPPGPYDSGTLIPLGAFMLANNTATENFCLLMDMAPATSAEWPPTCPVAVPAVLGANYSSIGQLLRPDYGQDAGAQAGPAFGKKRRVHWFSCAVERSQNFNISTNGTFPAGVATDLVTVQDEDENVVSQPALYTGTLSTTMPDNYSFDGQIAWQVTRPTPLIVTAMGGYLATQDK